MSITSNYVAFNSLDGLTLRGILMTPETPAGTPTVLVHGGGVTREEGGFFTRLAFGLAQKGLCSLRFDFRGHGESDGRQEDLTLSSITNDIRAAVDYLRSETGGEQVNIIGTSFGGGISALFTSRYPLSVRRLVLFNPLLNYKKRFIDDKPYWNNDRLDEEMARHLKDDGFVEHSPTFRLGRPLLNELFHLRPDRELGTILTPTLIVHGTGDTFIPIQSSRDAIGHFGGAVNLLEIDGAQHGFAVHDDPQYANPQTQEWQAYVIRIASDWLSQE
ncbi:alpha/beta hydrolase [Actinomadura formosensis]|uniref:alpha/beta hydrolase n=1 Tax=Actinomadura formosensis TaxID=60706 RepID=UPI000A93519A|nr:alpha/beta fold hydrolase [Actinomadura formosensis]